MGDPSPQRARISFQEAKDLGVLGAKRLGGNEVSARRGILVWGQAGTLDLTQEDFGRLLRFPVLGRRTFKPPCGDTAPGTQLTSRIV